MADNGKSPQTSWYDCLQHKRLELHKQIMITLKIIKSGCLKADKLHNQVRWLQVSKGKQESSDNGLSEINSGK